MFGIGLPEMILIMALALIVVGPDKLPELARSLAKGLTELKKTAEGLKEQLTEDGNPLDDIKPDLEHAARSLKENLLDVPHQFDTESPSTKPKNGREETAAADAYKELVQHSEKKQDIVQPDHDAAAEPAAEHNSEKDAGATQSEPEK